MRVRDGLLPVLVYTCSIIVGTGQFSLHRSTRHATLVHRSDALSLLLIAKAKGPERRRIRWETCHLPAWHPRMECSPEGADRAAEVWGGRGCVPSPRAWPPMDVHSITTRRCPYPSGWGNTGQALQLSTAQLQGIPSNRLGSCVSCCLRNSYSHGSCMTLPATRQPHTQAPRLPCRAAPTCAHLPLPASACLADN